MYRTMLLVLDGSELAEIVFPYATELCGRLDMDAVLLHVYAPATTEFVPMYRAYVDRAAEHLLEQARRVQQLAGPGKTRDISVRGELEMGYHADAILKFAESHSINLILMASHGRSGARRWTIGSVADKILRASKVPVWLVHADAEKQVSYDRWPTRTLLVPLTGSGISAAVLPHAINIARQRGVTVDVALMEVVEPPLAPSYYSPEITGVPLNWGQFMEQEMARSKKAAEEYLHNVEKQFRDIGIPVRSSVVTGKPSEEIAAFARSNPYTVIVMATHGRTGLSRLVYGSVAESVIFGVTNPVVLVRPQEK